MAKILFIVRSFSFSGAQPLRFRNIVNFLCNDHEIHILEFGNTNEEVRLTRNVKVYRRKYSKIGKIFNGFSENNSKTNNIQTKPNSFLVISFRFLKSILFPDPFIIEYFKLKRNVESLITNNSYDFVVGSGFPHTVLLMSSIIRKKGIDFIYDIGDPFYGNANNSCVKNFFAKRYERFFLKKINLLVVTNEQTKIFYLNHYSFLADKISVVEQGIVLPETKSILTIENIVNQKSYKLIYAGQFYKKLREPYNLYAAVEEINTKDRKYILEIYGNISDIFKIKNSKHIKFYGYMPNDIIWKEINLCDIVVFIDNALGMQTPGKIFEVIASMKPVLFIYSNEETPAFLIAKAYPNIFFAKNTKENIISTLEVITKEAQNFYNIDVKMFSWSNRAKDFEKSMLSIKNDYVS